MQALVAGRHAVGVFVVPVAAYVVGGLKAVVRNVELFEPFDGTNAAGARTNDTAFWGGVRRHS